MENKIKTILIIFAAVLGASLFLTGSAFADNNLIVEFEKTPLFDEANFLPGQGITRWVKVTNNSGQTQRIATEAINVSDPNRLGDVLNLEIKEGGTRLYNNALSKFFTEGEVYFSGLANGTLTQYDFIVTFFPGTQNSFQGKSLSFDILVGFQGEEGGILPGAGGGGGGYLPPGLTIPEESVKITVTETSVTIEWTTSYPATSQVIYAKDGEKHILDLTDYSGTPPKYGYESTMPENPLKVTSHLVTITGLDSGTKYYYRAISHASLAISQEHSFITLGVGEIGEKVEEEGAVGEEIIEGKPFEEEGVGAIGEKEGEGEEKGGEKEETVGGLEGPELVEVGIEEPTGLGSFLAAIGAFPLNLKVILVIVGLILIILIILRLIKKKK